MMQIWEVSEEEKEKQRQERLEWALGYRGKVVGNDEVWGTVCEFDELYKDSQQVDIEKARICK